MKATMLAHDLLLGGEERILVAGGMESMTSAPLTCFPVLGLAYGSAMVKSSTTCSLTALKTPTTAEN